MNRYIKSEAYRLIHSKFTYLFIGISSILLVLSIFVLWSVGQSDNSFPYATTKFAMNLMVGYFPVLFLLCVMVANMIFGNEYNNHTMKNCVSYGIPRSTIYFGKLLAEVIYSIIAFVVIIAIYLASAYLLLKNSGTEYFELFLRAILVALPLFLYVVGVTNCFTFIIEGTGGAIAAISGLIILVPLVCQLAGHRFELFRTVNTYLPWTLLNGIGTDDKCNLVLPWSGNTGYYIYWIAGIGQMLLFVIIGYLAYRKREVK